MDICFTVASISLITYPKKWESSICKTSFRPISKKTLASSSNVAMKGFGGDKNETNASKPKVVSYDKLKRLLPDLEPVYVYVTPKGKVNWKLTGRVLSTENQHERGLYTNKKLIIDHAKKAHMELKVAKALDVGYSVGKEPAESEEAVKEIIRVDGSYELIESAFDGVSKTSESADKKRLHYINPS